MKVCRTLRDQSGAINKEIGTDCSESNKKSTRERVLKKGLNDAGSPNKPTSAQEEKCSAFHTRGEVKLFSLKET